MADTTIKISPKVVFGTTHFWLEKSKLVTELDIHQTVNKVQIFRDDKGDYYLVLKE